MIIVIGYFYLVVCNKLDLVIIFIILVLLLHFGVPPNFCIKLVCRELKKVDNHWSKVSAKMTKVLYHFKFFYMDSGVNYWYLM